MVAAAEWTVATDKTSRQASQQGVVVVVGAGDVYNFTMAAVSTKLKRWVQAEQTMCGEVKCECPKFVFLFFINQKLTLTWLTTSLKLRVHFLIVPTLPLFTQQCLGD